MAIDPEIQQIVCCMGQPVAGNPTQYMIEKAFHAADLAWRYVTLEVPPENLAASVAGMKSMGMRGGNFTIPHKVEVIAHLDDLSQAARLMGAVNCVNIVDGRLIGENTDGKGFVKSLTEVCDPAGKRIEILGAGGAARAIAVELAFSGVASITVVNRNEERGHDLAELIQNKVEVESQYLALDGDHEIDANTDVFINATSIGLGDAEARTPVDVDTLRKDLVVADVIFNPPRTRLIRDAEQQGCTTLDGLGMLVNQGVTGFEIWTGVTPDANVMREALEEYLGV